MNFENLNSFRIFSDKLRINQNAFIHIIPDFNITVGDILQYLNLDYTKCQAMLVKTSIFHIGNKILQPKQYYSQLKNKKNLPVNIIQLIPNKVPDNKYYIVDHTVTAQGVEHFNLSIGEKQSGIYLIQQLKSEVKNLKTKFPKHENLVIFAVTQDNGIMQILNKLTQIEQYETLNCFDKFALVAVSAGTDLTTFIPILSYDTKGNVEILKSNFPKITKALTLATPDTTKIVDSRTPEEGKEPTDLNKITTDIANDTVVDNIKKDLEEDMYKVQTEIDSARLSRVLKNYKIQDENTANNVKLAVNDYLDRNKNTTIQKTNLEDVVLKSIHYTLFGTDNVQDTYKAKPDLLISKLQEYDTFSKHVTYPEPVHNITLVSPKDTIQMNRFTGPVRHPFEFNENIHANIKTLFKSLEKKPNFPVKIQKFDYTYNDDNLNRFIDYNITMKNLAGGKSEPYNVNIRVPALVNDRYFKLNGMLYVLANQQFLHPLTKDKNTEARAISHFGMIRLKTVNMKFNVSQIEDIVNFIKLKFPYLIADSEVDLNGKIQKISFIDPKKTTINFNSSIPFENDEKQIYIDDNLYFLKDKKSGKDKKVNKSEYIFEFLANMIKDVDPNEELKRSKKSIPYLEAFVMSRKLPFIIYLWQQIGLINALTKLNIKYEISQVPEKGIPDINLQLEDGKYLYIYGDTKRQELIANGLLTFPKGFTLKSENLNDKTFLDNYINEKFGTRTVETLNLSTINFIDPVTKSLLDYQDYPDNLIDILCGPLLDKLLNDPVDAPNDLNSLRVRQSEMMSHILYKELSMAHNKYVKDMQYGMKEASMFLDPNYVTDFLMGRHEHSSDEGGSALTFVNPHNPIDEITQASKVIKTGVGGIPSKRSFNKFHRGIHPTYIGNIGAHENTEYSNVKFSATLKSL